jgi:hypothetical protein
MMRGLASHFNGDEVGMLDSQVTYGFAAREAMAHLRVVCYGVSRATTF